MKCSNICQKIHSFFFSFQSAPTTSREKKDLLKGFFPVMSDYLYQCTNNWLKEYKWQFGHPVRIKGMRYLEVAAQQLGLQPIIPGRLGFYIQSKICPTICTITSHNVFSVFMENLTEEDKSINMRSKQQKGVGNFKKFIDEILSQEERGLACLCVISTSSGKDIENDIHEFVIEIAPCGKCYIYQSITGIYTLKSRLKEMVPLTVDQLIKQLNCITSEDYDKHSRGSEEARKAFKELFFFDIDSHAAFFNCSLQRVDFFYVPLIYSINSIPIVAQKNSLIKSIVNIWEQKQ